MKNELGDSLTKDVIQRLIDLSNPYLSGKSIIELETIPELSINDAFVQTSFFFSSTPKICFVDQTGEIATLYSELPKVVLTEEEIETVAKWVEVQAEKEAKYVNKKHFLIEDITYNHAKNTVFLKAFQTDYEIMSALSRKFADKFKTGVITPFITTDDQVLILERNDRWGLNSAVAGFIEPDGFEKSLENLVEKTAVYETIEEVLGIYPEGKIYDPFTKTKHMEYDKPLSELELQTAIGDISISQLSFRSPHRSSDQAPFSIGTAEFIAPQRLLINSQSLRAIIENNTAPHYYEHTIDRHQEELKILKALLQSIGQKEAATELAKMQSIIQYYSQNKYLSNEIKDKLEFYDRILKNKVILEELQSYIQKYQESDECRGYRFVDLNSLDRILEAWSAKPSWLVKPIISAALPNDTFKDFIDVAELTAEELAIKLLTLDSQKYSLTPETQYLSKIVFHILKEHPEQINELLTPSIMRVVVGSKDEYSDEIRKLITGNEESLVTWPEVSTIQIE